MKASPKFKRAVEAELKRLREERPVFGQGGLAGTVTRNLDQRLAQLEGQPQSLFKSIDTLAQGYDNVGRRMTSQLDESQQQRLFAIIRELKKTRKAMGEVVSSLNKAIRL